MLKQRRALWILLAVLILAAGIGTAALKKSKPAVTPTAESPVVLEFLPFDVTTVRARELRQLLPLSGSLRAVNQAAVKARVSGEVHEVLVREGEAVRAGQILVRMDTNEYQARVEQAKGALLAARGQLEIATNARDNNKALLAKGFISKNAYDNAASQYDIALANVNSARGALDVAQKALADTVIRAPISGLISSRTVQPGEKVSPDNRLLDVVDLHQMEMEASVPTADILNVTAGQDVQVKVEGLTEPIAGKVVRINPATQSGSRSIMVYVQIDNPQGVLRVGMFGEAQLTLSKKSGVLTVPQAAIQGDDSHAFVYAIDNDRIVRKPVALGMYGNDGTGNAVEVLQGLAAGTQIVKTNLGMLREGTLVKFAPTGGVTEAANRAANGIAPAGK